MIDKVYVYGIGNEEYSMDVIYNEIVEGSPKVGDLFFLFKVIKPRGIVAKAEVINLYDDGSIQFKINESRNKDSFVSELLLQHQYPRYVWPKRKSYIPHDAIVSYADLNQLWDESRNKHPVVQMLNQFKVNKDPNSWYKKYVDFVAWFKEARVNLTDENVIKIWSDADAISSIAPQRIKPEQCIENISVLRKIVEKIIESPTPTTHKEIKDLWRNDTTFNLVLHVAINRIFAMNDSHRFTSIVSEGKYFKKLYQELIPYLDITMKYDNWVESNIALKEALNSLFNIDDVELNTLLWELADYLENGGRTEVQIENTNNQKSTLNETKPIFKVRENIKCSPLNQILYGPPGTGKTYTTINKALQIVAPDFYLENKDNREKLKARFDELLNNNRIGFVTFHQSFSYEDFVEGLKASTTEDKQISYDVEDGIFKSMCNSVSEKLLTNINEKRVLIIDEINRGNISNIFGELITLIEPSKRSGGSESLSVKLPYSKETFSVPSNLHIIGTMNTADKSLAQLDIALRRRFEFVEMMTNYELLKGISDIEGINVAKLVKTMNQRIELLYDREHTIGHSFFLPLLGNPSLQLLAEIFELQILPLLEEYFFEDWERVGQVLGDHLKDNHDLRFIVEQFGNSEIAELMGDDWEVQGIQPYCRNQEAFKNPQAYIGVYTR
ncbi:McrB family protein [Aliivibrio sp. EL58]|uniref:McrB family protein n=1 Tax=Aliivibrio sp. EL58 TaxID=2107582 RepID=UPI0020B17451|nr:AAA family ATPase [Aliivibrio sp. EL58]